MAGYSKDSPGSDDVDSHSSVDEREKTLGKLDDMLSGHDRQDMTLTMDQLSLEFFRHTSLAEDYIHQNKLGGAEGHRLIAEAIHHTLKTLEVKRRTIVKIIPPAAAAASTSTTGATTGTTSTLTDSAIKEVKEDEV